MLTPRRAAAVPAYLALAALVLAAPCAGRSAPPDSPPAASPPPGGLGDILVDWAAPGEAVAPPASARNLALRFLEWEYLARWAEAAAGGEAAGEAPRRWAAARRLRLEEDEAVPAWDRERRERGVCLHERLGLAALDLPACTDSLRAGRLGPVQLLLEGILEGMLLAELGRPGCGAAGDPAARLAEAVGGAGGWSLEELKEGVDFAGLYFAAERAVTAARRQALGRVEAWLARPGLLVSVKYGWHRIRTLEADAPAERLGEEHWLYPAGLRVEWDGGRRLAASGISMLHHPAQNLFQAIEPEGEPRVHHGGEVLAASLGEYRLRGEYRIETEHLSLWMDGGRYRRNDEELRLWLPGGFLSANRGGLLAAAVLAAVSAFLLVRGRRRLRELRRPVERPRRRF
ncbi:MAG: hypothetical protein JW819_11900 [Candidatus Krumholzibacteriota bacterium]|nr:hypothetical protein [Candidatus Krumholzibacteriota bacterium]